MGFEFTDAVESGLGKSNENNDVKVPVVKDESINKSFNRSTQRVSDITIPIPTEPKDDKLRREDFDSFTDYLKYLAGNRIGLNNL